RGRTCSLQCCPTCGSRPSPRPATTSCARSRRSTARSSPVGGAMSQPDEWARAFVSGARVGRLATASASGAPHPVPCVYALLDDAIYSVVDEKPKSGRRLLRLRNIEATRRAALVVDH